MEKYFSSVFDATLNWFMLLWLKAGLLKEYDQSLSLCSFPTQTHLVLIIALSVADLFLMLVLTASVREFLLVFKIHVRLAIDLGQYIPKLGPFRRKRKS